MRNYWGTLAGAILGLLGGLPAAAFGAFLGFLIDLILAELRAHRFTVLFLETGEAHDEFPEHVALAGLLYGHLRSRSTDRHEALASRLLSLQSGRLHDRLIERVVSTATAYAWVGTPRFVELLCSCSTVREREHLFRTVWDALAETGSTRCARDEAHEIARKAGLDEGFIVRELVVHRMHDPEACQVLGVARDASQAEIRAAYLRLVAQFHPDTATGLTEEQQEATELAFKRIQAAYEKLRDA